MRHRGFAHVYLCLSALSLTVVKESYAVDTSQAKRTEREEEAASINTTSTQSYHSVDLPCYYNIPLSAKSSVFLSSFFFFFNKKDRSIMQLVLDVRRYQLIQRTMHQIGVLIMNLNGALIPRGNTNPADMHRLLYRK